MQLVSGLHTGSAVVRVALHEPVYSQVTEASVRLLVLANAQLSPALVYLIPDARLVLRVHVVQQGDDEGIFTNCFLNCRLRNSYSFLYTL